MDMQNVNLARLNSKGCIRKDKNLMDGVLVRNDHLNSFSLSSEVN